MKKLTIEDVAKKAGVSKSTVSQFLNKRFKYMSEATKNRIAEVIDELNYQPNGLARSLKQNRTHMVGIIVANIDYSLSIQCIRAIENELQRHGIQVIICNSDENADKENTYVETLVARQVDGLIIFPAGDQPAPYTRLIEAEYPLVFMDRLVDGITTQSLLLDNEMAVKTAIRELTGHGHEAIAILSLPLGVHAITPRKERMSGYKKRWRKRVCRCWVRICEVCHAKTSHLHWTSCCSFPSLQQRCLPPMIWYWAKFLNMRTAMPLRSPASCRSSASTMPNSPGSIILILQRSASRLTRWGCRRPRSCSL